MDPQPSAQTAHEQHKAKVAGDAHNHKTLLDNKITVFQATSALGRAKACDVLRQEMHVHLDEYLDAVEKYLALQGQA